MESVLSTRSIKATSAEPSLLYTGFVKCKADPYHPDTNPGGIINLGTSENQICDDILIPKLESVGKITPKQLQYFPVNGLPEFRAEIARFISEKTVADVEITLGDVSIVNGCSSAFCSLAFAIGNEGDHYLIPAPYYGMTEKYMGVYMGLKPIGVELDDENQVSVELLTETYKSAIQENKTVCGVVLINPHNPTGAVYSKQRVLDVLEFAKDRQLHVVIDEIYFLSMFEQGEFESSLSYTLQWPDPMRTHFIWGFSKDFAMSGSRCAMIYSKNKDLIQTLGGASGFFHLVPGIMQMKLCEMLRDRDWVDAFLEVSRMRLQHNARIVMEALDEFNIPYLKPTGTLYIWADFTRLFKEPPTDDEAVTIFFKMMEHLVYIPSAKGFNGTNPKYFRIVYSIPEMDLIEAMRRFREFVNVHLASNVI